MKSELDMHWKEYVRVRDQNRGVIADREELSLIVSLQRQAISEAFDLLAQGDEDEGA